MFAAMLAVAHKFHQELAPGDGFPAWKPVVEAIHQRLQEDRVWETLPRKTQWMMELLLKGTFLPGNTSPCRWLVEDGVLSIMSALASADKMVAEASQ
jgi:hypothetical protein